MENRDDQRWQDRRTNRSIRGGEQEERGKLAGAWRSRLGHAALL
jgi:hypothetical protein